MTRDTPAEAARRFVDEWLDEWKLRASPHVPEEGLTEEEIDDLVARLAPIFERAQQFDTINDTDAYILSLENDALRERAERAEAKLADATAYCSGAFPCEASTAASFLERKLNDAEADVARLAAVVRCRITGNLCGTDTWVLGSSCPCEACQAWLATTEHKP